MPGREPVMADGEPLKRRVSAGVDERLGALLRISRRLHENPETAWRENAASAFLADELAARGFAVERGAAGLPTAFVAEYGAGAVTVGLSVVEGATWRVTDLRVDDADDPAAELSRLLALWLPLKRDYLARALDPDAAPSYGVPGDL